MTPAIGLYRAGFLLTLDDTAIGLYEAGFPLTLDDTAVGPYGQGLAHTAGTLLDCGTLLALLVQLLS